MITLKKCRWVGERNQQYAGVVNKIKACGVCLSRTARYGNQHFLFMGFSSGAMAGVAAWLKIKNITDIFYIFDLCLYRVSELLFCRVSPECLGVVKHQRSMAEESFINCRRQTL